MSDLTKVQQSELDIIIGKIQCDSVAWATNTKVRENYYKSSAEIIHAIQKVFTEPPTDRG